MDHEDYEHVHAHTRHGLSHPRKHIHGCVCVYLPDSDKVSEPVCRGGLHSPIY